MNEIKERIEKLRQDITKYNEYYYNKSESLVSDEEYDMLLKELKDLEEKYPEYDDPNSPTKKIIVIPSSSFEKTKHLKPMLSLDNVYSIDELKKWFKNFDNNVEFLVEMKMDGASVNLLYENNKLTIGSSRGNGIIGENITQNIFQIKSIPKTIKENCKIELRGEAYLTKENFNLMNNNNEYSNARNAVSGSIRTKNPKETKDRNISFALHSIGYFEGLNIENQSDFYDLFPEFFNALLYKGNDRDKIINIIEEYETTRKTLPFEIDGIVIKVNNLKLQEKYGCTSKFPKWGIAYKFKAEKATTILVNIINQVGRTGIITPVAVFDQVDFNGVKVSYATLHNYEEIQRLNINIGDEICVERSADVIPKITCVVTKNSEGYYQPPERCPECNNELFKDEKFVAYKCTNEYCSGIAKAKLIHFVSKNAMNIEGLGNETITYMVHHGIINDIEDIYTKLNYTSLSLIPNFKDKKITNIKNSIEKSKNINVKNFIYALGIPTIGLSVSEEIANKIVNIYELFNEECIDSLDLTPVITQNLKDWFMNEDNKNKIHLLLQHIHLQYNNRNINMNGKLKDLKFVITGTLSKPRGEFERLILENGGVVSSSVSKKTDYLLLGENPGSKYTKAQKLNTKIINEEQFNNLIEN